MTKAKKKRVRTTGNDPRAPRAVASAHRKRSQATGEASTASMEAQMAAMEAQMAAMEEQIALLRGDPPPPASRLKPATRAVALPAPENVQVELAGGTRLRVQWDPVDHAGGYSVRYSVNSTFSSEVSWRYVDPDATTCMVYDLKPETAYYVGVRAFGTGDRQDSIYSASQTITTGVASGGGGDGGDNGGEEGHGEDTATHLRHWFDALRLGLQNIGLLVPELGNTVLDPTERKRLLGSGVRRYGYIDKISDTAEAWPQFWPSFVLDDDEVGQERLKELLREIEALRNLLIFFENGARAVQDVLLLRGHEAFRLANLYYATVRESARRQIPDAEAVFDLIRLFWKRRRNGNAEPTEREAMRDFQAVLHGHKDGIVAAARESGQVAQGNKAVIDATYPAKQRRGMRLEEREPAE